MPFRVDRFIIRSSEGRVRLAITVEDARAAAAKGAWEDLGARRAERRICLLGSAVLSVFRSGDVARLLCPV